MCRLHAIRSALERSAESNACGCERLVGERAGFYGLDVYSLYESMAAVIDYLRDLDSELADRARDAYHCFEPYGEDAREYASSIRLVPEDCEEGEVLEVLRELREEVAERHADRREERRVLLPRDGPRRARVLERPRSPHEPKCRLVRMNQR